MRIIIGLLLTVASRLSSAPLDRPLPLFFFPNSGQTDSSVKYIIQTPDLSARFSPDTAIFQVDQNQVAIRFLDANPHTTITPLDPLAAKVNFFLGSSGWKTDVPAYSKIVYQDLYPGIDLTYAGTGRQVKSEFHVGPGADPNLIRLQYSSPVTIDSAGNLQAGGQFREDAPVIYQQLGAQRLKINGRYQRIDTYTVGFQIGGYDHSAPLIIDPTVTYCTYLGGSAVTSITGVAVDSSANLYVTGWTAALNFPISNSVEAANQGGVDVIVAKLNAAGTALVYATYIGGRSDDQGSAIAVDSLGQAYVTGFTSSSNFPLVQSNRAGIGGTTTAFALKLNAAGNTLLYSGYLGGTVYEQGAAIAVDSSSNAYISGTTQSSNFPILNAPQPTFGGSVDVFITRLNAAGAITFSTFLGGSGNEEAGGIAVDSGGNMFVAGGTSSSNFPVQAALHSTLTGSQDAFLTKISFSGALLFSTFYGGSGGSPQQASAVTVDSSGNPYFTGVTTSTDFPISSGVFQTVNNGLQNVFVVKLTSTGALAYSTYLGGSSFDWGYGIAVNASGYAYVAGNTSSVDFPQSGAVQAVFGGLYDAFVSELNFGGTALLFSTYYGGTGSDAANAIALDSNANIFVGGQTGSSNLPLLNPIQSSSAASSTGWLLRLGVTAPPPTTPSVVSLSPTSGTGSAVNFTAQFADSGGAATLSSAALLLNTSSSTTSGCYISYSPATNVLSVYNDAGTGIIANITPGSGSGQNDQCSLIGTSSSVSVSGTALTVVFTVTFLPGFAGSKTVYLRATDANSSTGWMAEGTYTATVNPGTPQVTSVTPSAASGSTQTFTAVFADTVIASNLSAVAIVISSNTGLATSCSITYTLSANTIALVADDGNSSSAAPLGTAGSLQNSQCSIGANSASQSGLYLTFNISITFKGAFNGPRNIYLDASTATVATGLILTGTYTVNSGGAPLAISSVPNSGTGAGERFSFTISDVAGSSFLTGGAILFASTFNTSNACYLIWDGTHNTISLTYDVPTNGQTPLTPGAPGIATNEQCTMNSANSTIVTGATQVVITLDLTFNSSFFGAKNIYLYAAETFSNSGWATVGSWTVTGGASTANSVSPNSGAGTSPTFVFTVSDSSSQTNLTGMSMLLTPGAPSNIANACYLVYLRTVNTATIGLWDNTGNTTLNTKAIGSSANLLNSQCAVGSTSTNIVGNSLQLSIQLVFFKPAFAGLQSIYLDAMEPNAMSGFVYQGSWTVQ